MICSLAFAESNEYNEQFCELYQEYRSDILNLDFDDFEKAFTEKFGEEQTQLFLDDIGVLKEMNEEDRQNSLIDFDISCKEILED